MQNFVEFPSKASRIPEMAESSSSREVGIERNAAQLDRFRVPSDTTRAPVIIILPWIRQAMNVLIRQASDYTYSLWEIEADFLETQ